MRQALRQTTNQPMIRVSLPQLIEFFERLLLEGRGGFIHPKTFFSKWIPQLYGVYPDERTGYRSACLTEIMIHLSGIVDRESVRSNWRWEDPASESFPKYLPAILAGADRYYTILKALRLLPRRSIE